MMKTMKKVFAALLTLAMILCMCAVPAFAGNGSITVGNAVPGQTYKAYKILDLESYNSTTGAYSYKIATGWNNFINSYTTGDSPLLTVTDGYVTWTGNQDDSTKAAFAQAALTYAQNNNVTPANGANGTTCKENEASVTMSSLDLGYYVVDSSLGALCALTTTKPAANFDEKNEKPYVDKKVQENSTQQYGSTNDAAVGSTVTFQATITVGKGGQKYELHDVMSTGLSFVEIKSIKIGDNDVESKNYDVIKKGNTTAPSDSCTFEVKFHDDYIAGLSKNTKIIVTYTATLNENAEVGNNGNDNDVTLKYGDESTVTSKTKTYTWGIPIYKYTTNVIKLSHF